MDMSIDTYLTRPNQTPRNPAKLSPFLFILIFAYQLESARATASTCEYVPSILWCNVTGKRNRDWVYLPNRTVSLQKLLLWLIGELLMPKYPSISFIDIPLYETEIHGFTYNWSDCTH